MKLIIAIVQKEDAADLSSTLIENGFYVTKLSTTGGFLKEGNVTFLIGASEEKIEEIKSIIKDTCKSRDMVISNPTPYPLSEGSDINFGLTTKIGGATIFILNIDEFEKY
ncbi:MAG: hypothetical protein GYA50_10560 [Eubacteriaceae bacterium]|nr:hypothetical protein [Eubacteriaceae bacterium]